MNKRLLISFFAILIVFFHGIVVKAENGKACYLINNEYPIIITNSLAVDSKENVYLANEIFNTVQVYNKYGRFQYAIEVDSSGGYYVDIDVNDNLQVVLVRSDMIETYDSKGYVINEEDIDSLYIYENYFKSKNIFRISNTAVFKLNKVFGYISVVKDTNGKYLNIYNISIWNWLLNLLIFGLMCSFGITILYVVFRTRIKNYFKKIRPKEFHFRSYYFWCEFGKGILDIKSKFGNHFEEKNFKRMELIRYTTSWLLSLILVISSVVFMINTGGLLDRGFEFIVRFIGVIYVYMITNLINLFIRYNFNEFHAKAHEHSTSV